MAEIVNLSAERERIEAAAVMKMRVLALVMTRCPEKRKLLMRAFAALDARDGR